MGDRDEWPGDDGDKAVIKPPIGAEAAAAFLGVKVRHFYNLPIDFINYGPKCHRWEPAVLENSSEAIASQ